MPATDEDGKDINPHIPQYISRTPWYLSLSQVTLKHQKSSLPQREVASIQEYYPRGQTAGRAARYKPGACPNCGATTHKLKECTERPRRVGAKWTNSEIAPDEVIKKLEFDWDGKRDRWNGYDPATHVQVAELYELQEQERQKKKEQALLAQDGAAAAAFEDEDTPLELTEAGAPMQKFDAQTRTTVRNLRIREDTAKYLYNLDPDSAYYDPKSRAMRANPNPSADPDGQKYAGDNFVRYTGEVQNFNEIRSFVWDAQERQGDIHLEAAPSLAEKTFRTVRSQTQTVQERQRSEILAKYGGEEHLQQLPPELIFAQTEQYVEYNRAGKVIKGQEAAPIRSKYPEDVTLSNHTRIWGSYWEDGQWGFACCRQLVKNSYCLGEAGIKIAMERLGGGEGARTDGGEDQGEAQQRQQPLNRELTAEEKKQRKKEQQKKAEAEEKSRKERLERALVFEERMQHQEVEKDERKRKYNSFAREGVEVTDEDMEAYHRKRRHTEDPMAALT
eukprot:TRINITY_DN8621_c0_g1_i2.p1 TRINITY_DN8621_c0_g1~~TRINITY_DN8621_c0_g1_i2.p1  ORF type:complete len:534 (-),score=134.01 TRINITY_DN8621_c0_g1_i2:57-1565(-)